MNSYYAIPTQSKTWTIIVLVILLILFFGPAIACTIIKDPVNPNYIATESSPIDPYAPTATYGAEQFHLQLTEVFEWEHAKTQTAATPAP